MSGQKTGLNALEMRKQLLLLESELNRAHLVNEWHEVKIRVHHLADEASMLGSLVSSVTKLGTLFTGLLQGFSSRDKDDENGKFSWISTLFSIGRMGVSLWDKLRSGRQ